MKYEPVKQPSTTKLQRLWTSIARITLEFITWSLGEHLNIHSHFWSVTPNGHSHLFFIVDNIPFKPQFKGGMNYNIAFSLVMRKYSNDQGLLAHEMTHADQAYRDGVIKHWYQISKVPQKRYDLEIEGYKVSMKFGMLPYQAANLLLTTGYYNLESLNLTRNGIMKRLNSKNE